MAIVGILTYYLFMSSLLLLLITITNNNSANGTYTDSHTICIRLFDDDDDILLPSADYQLQSDQLIRGLRD